ncbi:hypothetical protein NYE69_06890 [Paenibacillus sp. FSL R5-0527]|uniref:hypothetical protein n=1 Tax=Paenibacillus sp. FSL R5-0527 TaxID=2975321 RepID=UPI0030F8B1BC
MITSSKNFDDNLVIVRCSPGNFEHHLTIFPCYIVSIEKGENDTHGRMIAALLPGRTSSRFFYYHLNIGEKDWTKYGVFRIAFTISESKNAPTIMPAIMPASFLVVVNSVPPFN